MGRHDEAIAEMKKAVELDPLSLIINTNLGLLYSVTRRYDQALEQYRKTMEMDPNFFILRLQRALLYEQLGKYEEAIAERTKARLLVGENSDKVAADEAALRKALAISGEKGYWRKLLEVENARSAPFNAYFNAMVCARLEEKDKAFAWLERGYQNKELFPSLKAEPAFDNLRSDPRFVNLLRRMGLPP
jgi:tetratricopeptide (TPR) repeat protein